MHNQNIDETMRNKGEIHWERSWGFAVHRSLPYSVPSESDVQSRTAEFLFDGCSIFKYFLYCKRGRHTG